MSLHAVQYASSQVRKEPVRRKKKIKDENENNEVGSEKSGESAMDVAGALVETDAQIEQTGALIERERPSAGEDRENEFSDHSDTEFGFGPLPESVFEAIEDTQDSQPADDAPRPADGNGCDADGDAKLLAQKQRNSEKQRKVRTCPICAKVYTASSSYFYHMRHFHRRSKEHECGVCGRKFGTRGTLRQHAALHTGECPYQCRECGKRFRTKASVYIHEQTHSGVKTYACAHCELSFRWRTHLARHAQRHAAERRHVCAVCARAFSVRCDLLRHARTHQAGEHECAHCGVKFAQLRYLKVHMDRKHAAVEKPAPTVP